MHNSWAKSYFGECKNILFFSTSGAKNVLISNFVSDQFYSKLHFKKPKKNGANTFTRPECLIDRAIINHLSVLIGYGLLRVGC